MNINYNKLENHHRCFFEFQDTVTITTNVKFLEPFVKSNIEDFEDMVETLKLIKKNGGNVHLYTLPDMPLENIMFKFDENLSKGVFIKMYVNSIMKDSNDAIATFEKFIQRMKDNS